MYTVIINVKKLQKNNIISYLEYLYHYMLFYYNVLL